MLKENETKRNEAQRRSEIKQSQIKPNKAKQAVRNRNKQQYKTYWGRFFGVSEPSPSS
jgi:hypothetical protein